MAYKKKNLYDRGRLIMKAFSRVLPVDNRDVPEVRLALAVLERAVLDLYDSKLATDAANWFRRGGHVALCGYLGVDPDYLITLVDQSHDYHLKLQKGDV